ncbi:MAG: hypothetical protein ABW039_08135 [Sphingobium sp.]
MTWRSFATAVALTTLAHWSLPMAAMAQTTRDSITIEALATIVSPPPTLAIQSSASLAFGKVTLPRGNVSTCTYTLDVRGERASYVDGSPANGATCAFQDSAQTVGSVAIACDNGGVLAYSYGTDSPLQANGVSLIVDEDDIGFLSEEDIRFNQATCANGAATLHVGGRLSIASTADVSDSQVTVGRVTVDVFYDTGQCLGCQ